VYDDIDILAPLSQESASFQRNNDKNSVFVVTGASRGIGLQFVKDLLARTAGNVVALVRKTTNSQLNEFLSATPAEISERVLILPFDITDQSQIDAAAIHIQNQFQRVDCLFNIAGILGNPSSDPGPERSLAQLNRDFFKKNMEINAIGPLMLTKSLSPMMKTKRTDRAPSIVVNMSARVASISDNQGGINWISYRMSKAALNQGTRTISHELKRQGTWSIALYPGFTDTDLSKPFQKSVKKSDVFPVGFTTQRLLDVVDRMELRHSGGLYDWAGQALPF